MLEVKGIDTYYGNIQALRDVSLRVDDGEIVTLIGANGAGKSIGAFSAHPYACGECSPTRCKR